MQQSELGMLICEWGRRGRKEGGIKRCSRWFDRMRACAWPRGGGGGGDRDHSYFVRSMKAIPNRMDGGQRAELLALKHQSRILGQGLSGSRKSQASSPWFKQHRAYPVPSWRNHIQGWMNVWESYSRALEQETRTTRTTGRTAWLLSIHLSRTTLHPAPVDYRSVGNGRITTQIRVMNPLKGFK